MSDDKPLKQGWTAHPHKMQRIDGLAVVLAHPALWPVTDPTRPVWAVELPDLELGDPWRQAPLNAITIDEAIREADARFPCPDWHSSPDWRKQEEPIRVGHGRRLRARWMPVEIDER